jgi:phage terminase large subunit
MQRTINVEIDAKIFNPVYLPHLENYARTQIFFGGSSSGKSWFVIGQRAVIDLLRGGRNYLICRAVARTIRTSVFTQMERAIR